MAILTLENAIQKYDWGSTTSLPEILGSDNPRGEPWAELWMGAHPKAPSLAVDPASGDRMPLDRLIADDPAGTLGTAVAARSGDSLPFLFKVLSAARPLSIQAHPTKRKAEKGFAREELLGIALNAPERNYKDPNHKPETVVALSRFQGLCGFRPVDDIVANVRLLVPDEWERFAGRLATDRSRLELSVFFHTFISLSEERKRSRLAYAKARCANIVEREPPSSKTAYLFSWILRLMDAYPGDIGALAPVALNLFELEPWQALDLAAGVPHAYLEGTALEIMANSDNVLRGGLTSKHMDIPEFISSLTFDTGDIRVVEPRPSADGFREYPPCVGDYRLSWADVDGRLAVGPRAAVPEILFCAEGSLELARPGGASIRLGRGCSAFVTAGERAYELSGKGRVVRADVPA